MKFITAVVILGVAAYANAGGYPVVDIVHSGVPVGHHGPALVNSWGHGHAGILGGGYGGYGGAGIGHHGLVVGSPHGAPHIALATTGSGHYGGDAHGHGHHDGKYVASNRGATHVAPLVGHIQSVKSTNVEPAPGTTW